MLTRNELIELSKIDIANIDKTKLKELTDIHVDPTLPYIDKMTKIEEELGNPYTFLIDGTPVKIAYNNDGKTLEECLYRYFTKKRENDLNL